MIRWLFLFMLSAPAFAQDAQVQIDFSGEDEAASKKEDQAFYAPPIELIFQNQAIANGLASGADAINRSVESLMDSLFYSVLDNEINYYFTDDVWMSTTIKRDLYSTPSGAYVVVDRFLLGPRYSKELWRIHDIPINLGVDGTVEVLQIYLRTDGQRLAEQEDLSPARRWANNWFGLLPAAAMILPPSFNQNELYDPVKELETPFSFPLDVESFYAMPVGSIRSYALSGGVRLSPDFGGLLDQKSQSTLDRIGGLEANAPYSLFKRGEHRINVLRHGENHAWVGLTDLNRLGHSVSTGLGQKYFILRGALAAKFLSWDWIWTGVPVAMVPIDLNFEQAVAKVFDQVYEYDLRNPKAQEAYAAAVRGDFVPSRERYLDFKEKAEDTGVVFHFARTQDRKESIQRNGPNIAVYKKERNRNHTEAEVEITDQEGKFYVLESSLDVADKSWDILVGDEEARVQQTVEMKVKRVVDKDDPAKFEYAFETAEDPYRLTLSLNIQDRYVNTAEYRKYLGELRYFTALQLKDVPQIDLVDREQLVDWRRQNFFAEPTEQVAVIHPTATYLGRFGAQASISFSTKQLEKIVKSSENDIWAAFARAYEVDERDWRDPEIRRSIGFQMRWFKPFLLYPTRLINLRFSSVDAIVEAAHATRQLMALKSLKTPVELIDAFHEMLDSDHPRQLARGLLNLASIDQVPRRVTLSAQPKGSARHEVKQAYGKLNSVTFRAGPAFPEPTRYVKAKQKLANFYLEKPQEAEHKPKVSKIQVTTREIPASVRGLNEDPDDDDEEIKASDRKKRHVYVTIKVKDVTADGPLKLYVRVEQAGKVKIGKLALAEKVLDLTPVDATIDPAGGLTYEFFLTGPMSPLSTFMLNQAVGAGDQFLVSLAASHDRIVWSDERSVEFRFESGKLMQPK